MSRSPGSRGAVEPLWTISIGANVTSPVFHDGHIYWLQESGIAYCVEAATGKQVYGERIPKAGLTYASGVEADGKLFYVSQKNGAFVVAARPKFELLSHNQLKDVSRTNASPVIDNGRLLALAGARLPIPAWS